MLHSTRALVLRTVAYGDTSLIAHVLTEQYGLQQYLVKGARKASKKGGTAAAGMLQPAALLDMVVYHQELRQLQIIKEMQWNYVYAQVMQSITRNAIALYMVELLGKCLKQPERNDELFELAYQSLRLLDECEAAVAANLPLHFTLRLAGILGFQVEDGYSQNSPYLDLQEGRYLPEPPIHGMYLSPGLGQVTQQLLLHQQPVTLYRIRLNQAQRQELLQAYAHFFQYHLSDFGQLRTLAVLHEVLR